MSENLETLVIKANSGDKKALESVINEIQDLVYNLSLKMLLFHDDAKDATQEILIKIVTHLSTFKHESKFTTWVYRVATNYLISHKGKKSNSYAMSFDEYAKQVDTGQNDTVKYTQNEGELSLLEQDIRIGCTQGLLLCLNEEDRMVYILSVILDYNSKEGSEILGITPENFRKKLSRSKTKIQNFLNNKCGIVNENNPCRCKKKIDFLIDNKLMNPKKLEYATKENLIRIDFEEKIGALARMTAIYQAAPTFPAPKIIMQDLKQILNTN